MTLQDMERRIFRYNAATACTIIARPRRSLFPSGRWRYFWGRWGAAGEVVREAGDIFNIPMGIFRGFENIGTDYGMAMAILAGGGDAGSGVMRAPQVITDAADHGLVLGENGRL